MDLVSQPRLFGPLEPIYILRQGRFCDVTGLQSHVQVTDKFDANVDCDVWCNSTGQNPCILIWERSRSGVANSGCKRALRYTRKGKVW